MREHPVEVVAGVDRRRPSPASLRGQSRPWISPPMHFSAAAATTPSGVPPMPIRMSTPASGQARGDGAVDVAVADQADAGTGLRGPRRSVVGGVAGRG